MVRYLISVDQAFFGGSFSQDALEPTLEDLEKYKGPFLMKKFIHILINECKHPSIQSFKGLYKELGQNNIEEFRHFLIDMREYGEFIRNKKKDKEKESHRFDLKFIAENYLDCLDQT